MDITCIVMNQYKILELIDILYYKILQKMGWSETRIARNCCLNLITIHCEKYTCNCAYHTLYYYKFCRQWELMHPHSHAWPNPGRILSSLHREMEKIWKGTFETHNGLDSIVCRISITCRIFIYYNDWRRSRAYSFIEKSHKSNPSLPLSQL